MRPMKIVPIPRHTLARSVAEQLLNLITAGALKPGARMPSERALMDQLQVARSTVREALQILAASRIIEIRPGVGAFVRTHPRTRLPAARTARQAQRAGRSTAPHHASIAPVAPVAVAKPAPDEPIRVPDLKRDRLATFEFISWWERARVQAARVMVVGAGALGNEALKNLALMGIGNLCIVDFDTIEAANLSRSVLFRAEDGGEKKSLVAARRAKELNPDVRVQYFHGDVNTQIGLGVFRRMDVIIGCLDNREARLAINRFAYRMNKPWVDGAIQELFGLVRVFVPGQGACYECTLTEQARREIALRYSCPLLARQNILLGKVPTTPTISSIIAGLQTQDALKLLHGLPVQPGHVTHINGLTNDFHTTAYTPDENCASHWVYDEVRELADCQAATTTGADLLQIARAELGDAAVIELDQEIVTHLDCPHCGTTTQVFQPISQVTHTDGQCPGCGELRQVKMAHLITGAEPFMDRSLSTLGVPPLHILRARNADEYRFYELTGDLAATLHWSHFEDAARVHVHPRPAITLGQVVETPVEKPRPRIVVH